MSISLCITSYSQDYSLVYGLLEEFKKQILPPSEIIFYCSDVISVEMPKFLSIKSCNIPIHTIYSSKRTNQATARNISAKISSSEYVMFFDVDDIPHPMKIKITTDILNKTQADFMLHNYHEINESSNIFEQIPLDVDLYPLNEIDKNSTNVVCGDHYIHHAHISVKRSIFEKINFNESMEYYRREDGKFCQDLIINGYSGVYCPIKLVNYTPSYLRK
jgi:glycosyltransferase involved in cell wall biosynthesis